MSNSPNLELMKDAARILVAAGFEITGEWPDDERSFGNAMLELSATDLIVQMIVDRSRREVMIAPNSHPSQKVDLGPALTQLGIVNPGSAWPTFTEATSLFFEHRAQLPGVIAPARQALLEYWEGKIKR